MWWQIFTIWFRFGFGTMISGRLLNKAAPARAGYRLAQGSGPLYADHRKARCHPFGGTIAQRFGKEKKLGVLFGGTYDSHGRGHDVSPDWGSNFSITLQRPQELDDVLPLLHLQPVEPLDDAICLAALASMCLDSLCQVRSSPVVEQEHALPDTPERGGSELIRAGADLRDPVCQTRAHAMNEEVREEVHLLVRKSDTRIPACLL
jgi:hypothetical protein